MKTMFKGKREKFTRTAILATLLFLSSLFVGQAKAQQNLVGKEAIDHLKSVGQYESLDEAIHTAQYSMLKVAGAPEKVYAQNAKHGLNATFDSKGLHLNVPNKDKGSYQSNWRLESAGGAEVATGELRRDGQRLEISRPGLTEWFVNRPTGLEHGFTLESRPMEAGAKLLLSIAVEGDLIISVRDNGQRAELQDKETGLKVLDYDKLRVWDATNKELPARMAAAQNGEKLQLEVDDAGARYPLTIDPTFTQQAFLKADNLESNDEFGFSVAVSGDTAIVGARREDSSIIGDGSDNSGSFVGAAYVFVRDGATWSQQAFLKAPNTGNNDEFGTSVAISEDTLVIGSVGEASRTVDDPDDNTLFGAGAAYVFVRNGTTWSQQAFLKADNAGSRDRFGVSVAVSGNTIIVGANEEDSSATGGGDDGSATNAGAAYIFERSGTTWSQQAFLKADNAGAGDEFGISVAISGSTAVVGANEESSSADGGSEDNSAEAAGAAYVFVRNETSWSQQAFLKATNADEDDEFGISVGVSGDIIAVGANREDSSLSGGDADNSALNSGGAYVFVRSGETWSQQAFLKADNAEEGDRFGTSVALSGNTLVVGASSEDSSATGGGSDNSETVSGAAYVFMQSGTEWTQESFLKANNAGSTDTFGAKVAISGNTIIAGAIREDSDLTGGDDNSQSSSGAAYVFNVSIIEPLEITGIEVDAELDAISLTWRSLPNTTYRVDFSEDLITWEEGLVTGIESDANGSGFTTETIDLSELTLNGRPKLFIRVVEE